MTKVKKAQKREICNNVERSFNSSKEDNLSFLRRFDLDHKYGPCYGVKRLDRWNWAYSHNLHPPERVKTLINDNLNDKEFTEGIWYCHRNIL